MTEPAAKRAKHDNGAHAAEEEPKPFFNPELFTNESRDRLREKFRGSSPYRHLSLNTVCVPERLREVREEMIENLGATLKETDLFKVYQTGDLANIDGLQEQLQKKLPRLRALRDAIYSREFRDFVSYVLDLEELTDRVDCSCNTYAKGGHLLCHDDVITTRCVSYIIYLTDPDAEWRPEDGGALELFEVQEGEAGVPVVYPCKSVLPAFNSMVMFPVQPGQSFHSVQEVFSEDNPRMSISGWFHARAPPPGAELSSVRQLQASTGEPEFAECSGGAGADAQPGMLAEQDVEHLRRWVNSIYLEQEGLDQMVEKWEDGSCVQLIGFLKSDIASKIQDAVRAADAAEGVQAGWFPSCDAGHGNGWEAQGPAHKQRFLTFSGAAEAAETDGAAAAARSAAGALLAEVQRELLQSPPFARLVQRVTDLEITAQRGQVRRFRPGLDYTVAHYGGLSHGLRLDATLTFVNDDGEENSVAWASDEVGGFQCYTLADQKSADASEVYSQAAEADDDAVISCSAANNALNIVLRDSSLMKFVKYVSSAAPGSRWDVAMEYQVDAEEDMGDEDTGDSSGPVPKESEHA